MNQKCVAGKLMYKHTRMTDKKHEQSNCQFNDLQDFTL